MVFTSWIQARSHSNPKKFTMSMQAILVSLLLSALFLPDAALGDCSAELRRNLNIQGPDQDLLRKVDELIQTHAFRALLRPHTGTVYDVPLPMGLETGVYVQAVRLKTGSLIHRGFIFNEFIIPPRLSVTVSPPNGPKFVPEYVVLVYRFFNMRFSPYCMKNGLTIIGPVVGIKAYNGVNFALDSPPLDAEVVALEDPVTARIPILPLSDSNRINPALCALFDGHGNSSVSPMTFVNVCSMYQLGDSTLVNFSLKPGNDTGEGLNPSVEGAPSPAPVPAAQRIPPAAPADSLERSKPREHEKSSFSKLKVGLLSAMGAMTLTIVGAAAMILVLRLHQASVVSRMEQCSANSEGLGATLISQNSRPPCARTLRTPPVLERDYVFR